MQAEDVDARILSAIIAGVRRAFPFVVTEDIQPLIEKHSHALFKMIHTAPFSVAVQALLLLFQLMSAQNAINDRYYRCVLIVQCSVGCGVRKCWPLSPTDYVFLPCECGPMPLPCRNCRCTSFSTNECNVAMQGAVCCTAAS